MLQAMFSLFNMEVLLAWNTCTYMRGVLTSNPGYLYLLVKTAGRFFFRNNISVILKSPHQGQITNALYFRPAIISTSMVVQDMLILPHSAIYGHINEKCAKTVLQVQKRYLHILNLYQVYNTNFVMLEILKLSKWSMGGAVWTTWNQLLMARGVMTTWPHIASAGHRWWLVYFITFVNMSLFERGQEVEIVAWQ